ncbi:MAG: hypothetical protein SH856_09970 [Flavobacteriales bacterium]|nr:hypothetical protein [Flavobacteriales bacterium]
MTKNILIPALAVFLLLNTTVFHAQFYTGSNVEFGKNRVQYMDFDWYYFPAEHFHVYYYQGGQALAEYTVLSTETNLKSIESFFDYSLEDKIQVLTYQKQSEFRQSNIGISNDDQFNIGGTARILGNKMFLYYEGDHAKLEHQIRENISKIVFSQLMYGGDWKDVIKNSTLLSIPKWYEDGIVSMATERWNNETESFVRDLVHGGKFKSFNRFAGNDAKLAGHAFWKYIADVYGENVIPNILYMTRMSRNIESGFLFVLGISLDTVSADFINYYREKFPANIPGKSLPGYEPRPGENDVSKQELKAWKMRSRTLGEVSVRNKSKYQYSQFTLSTSADKIAYVTNEMGQYKIWIYDVLTQKKKRVLKREYKLDRLVDESYPVLAWHPSGQVLTYTFEKKGRAHIGNYNLDEKKTAEKELFRIDKVVDMHYSDDGKKIIFTGVREGVTDLYLYQVIGNNQEQLTKDIYDDVDARFIRNSTAVIFASNRLDDTLRTGTKAELFPVNKDIFIYDIESRSAILERVTATTDADETHPAEYDALHFTYLGDQAGIYNRYLANMDSAIISIDTTVHYRYFTTTNILSSYSRNPVDYEFNPKSGKYSLVFKKDGRSIFSSGDVEGDFAMNQAATNSSSDARAQTITQANTIILEPDTTDKGNVDINNYQFEDDVKDYSYDKEAVRIQEISADGTTSTDTTNKDFQMPKSRGYRLNFATDYVVTQVNNSFASPFYQNFSGPTSILPGISALVKMGMSDLFEDYKLVGGFRLALDLQNNDYGLIFENLRGRVDKKITFFRQAEQSFFEFDVFKSHTHSFQYQLKYPFTELASARATLIYRNDRIVRQSIDPLSLVTPNFTEHNLGLRLEYVFDNTINKGINLFNGTRWKVWAETYRQPDKYTEKTDFNVVGFDVRHYKKIHRDLIAAFRVAGSSSFGNYKLVHYLGGEDNWLFQKIDEDMPIATNQNYWFQALASPMRGFWVNARNGNSVVMSSAEVRWPMFRYLMKTPIKSDFLENFQLISFFDAGTAWTGNNPYSDENMLNSQSITINPVTVTIHNNREPIIYGYGFGMRSRVLGYFVRADWSWGIDDGRVLPRVFYLSLNLDF